jgi:hypothetical protein
LVKVSPPLLGKPSAETVSRPHERLGETKVKAMRVRQAIALLALAIAVALHGPARAATYYVDGANGKVQKRLWVVNNTVADNVEGIRVVDRGGWQILRNVTVMNNLVLRNTEPCDTSNHSDYNVFCAGTPVFFKPGYGFGNTRTLEQWRERFGEDKHSRVVPVAFESSHAGFKLMALEGLDVAGPLPEEVTSVWKATNPRRVGANLTRWP